MLWKGKASCGPAVNSDASRGLEYFFLHSLRILARCDPSPLWSYTTTQVLNSESSLHAIASAIGKQHGAVELTGGFVSDNREACVLYAKAVSRFQCAVASCTPKDAADITLGCFLMSILESLRGPVTGPLTHLRGAMSIIEAKGVCPSDGSPASESARLLERATVAGLLFNPVSTTASPMQECAWRIWDVEENVVDLDDERQLKLSVARLSSHLTRSMKLARMGRNCTDSNLQLHISTLQERQADIQHAMAECLPRLERDNSEMSTSLRCVYAQFLLITIILRNTWTGLQTAYDTELDTFRTVLELVEKSLSELCGSCGGMSNTPYCFSTGLGLIPILTIVARLCRHPQTRREAIELLRQCPQREGVWDSRLGEAACNAIIAFEEKQAGIDIAIPGDTFIPEHCRVHYYEAIIDVEDNAFPESIAICYKRHPSDEEFVVEELEIERPG